MYFFSLVFVFCWSPYIFKLAVNLAAAARAAFYCHAANAAAAAFTYFGKYELIMSGVLEVCAWGVSVFQIYRLVYIYIHIRGMHDEVAVAVAFVVVVVAFGLVLVLKS